MDRWGEAVPRDTVLRAHARQGPRMPSAMCETRVSCERAFLVLRPSCRRGDAAAHRWGAGAEWGWGCVWGEGSSWNSSYFCSTFP